MARCASWAIRSLSKLSLSRRNTRCGSGGFGYVSGTFAGCGIVSCPGALLSSKKTQTDTKATARKAKVLGRCNSFDRSRLCKSFMAISFPLVVVVARREYCRDPLRRCALDARDPRCRMMVEGWRMWDEPLPFLQPLDPSSLLLHPSSFLSRVRRAFQGLQVVDAATPAAARKDQGTPDCSVRPL